MSENLYNKSFYQMIRTTAGDSVKPVLSALKKHYHGEIHSAIDLGCGIGMWLKGIKDIFDEHAKIRGYDGEYIDNEELVINEEEFVAWNLKNEIDIKEKYDIAISLEVIEHLPKEYEDIFINSLVKLSNIILFSAALPNQNGVGHVNEQPLSYWIKKFDEKDYEFYDIIRPYIWENKKVSFWYKQNSVVFIRRNSEEKLLMDNCTKRIVDIVHPELLQVKEENNIFEKNDTLWRCYHQIGIVRDLFDSLPDCGTVIRMGGLHTKKMLSLIGAKNKKKIDAIIDSNSDCACKDEGYSIINLDKISELKNIHTIILSSFVKRDMLIYESRLYPSKIKVIDIYQYLEENKCSCIKEFFE